MTFFQTDFLTEKCSTRYERTWLSQTLMMLYFCSSFSAYNIHDDKMPQWRAPSSIFCHVRTNFCKAFNALKNDIREHCGQNWLQKVASFRTFVSQVCSYLKKNFSLSSYIVTKNVCSFSPAEVRNKGFIHSMGQIIWGFQTLVFTISICSMSRIVVYCLMSSNNSLINDHLLPLSIYYRLNSPTS